MGTESAEYRREAFVWPRRRRSDNRLRMVPCAVESHAPHRGCRQTTPHDLVQLLHRASRGDQDAFGRFYDVTSHTVFGMVLAVVSDRADAEAIAEAIYLAAWRLAPAFDASTSEPEGWLALITGQHLVTRCARRQPPPL